MSLLTASDIRMSYGSIEVLKGVGFEVEAGQTFAIIGPNGAGKTTLFKVLTGEAIGQTGRVVFGDKDISRLPEFVRARMGIGRTFQVARIFNELTVITNIVVAIEARQSAAGQRSRPWYRWRPGASVQLEAAQALDSVELSDKKDLAAQFLSHGDRKRLELAVVLATNPKILMLDEPTAGMSPADRRAMTALLRKAKLERQLTIVMTEHDMDVIFGLADRLMVLNYGEVICVGAPADVRDDQTVKDVYLGKGAVHA